jgi:hypothetical protein
MIILTRRSRIYKMRRGRSEIKGKSLGGERSYWLIGLIGVVNLAWGFFVLKSYLVVPVLTPLFAGRGFLGALLLPALVPFVAYNALIFSAYLWLDTRDERTAETYLLQWFRRMGTPSSYSSFRGNSW